jgi:YD repeat-containing protein
MFSLGLDRTTYLYGDGDDPIEETTEHSHREANLAEDGTVQYTPDKVAAQQNRFEYRYDEHGNWVEKTVLNRPERNADFQASNITRRAITYYRF